MEIALDEEWVEIRLREIIIVIAHYGMNKWVIK
jgi:hypothetical protein